MDDVDQLERVSPSSLGEFLEELSLTVSGTHQNMQMGGRSIYLRASRLDKKNKVCDIPVAKREYRRT
jgi:hypothetical protein